MRLKIQRNDRIFITGRSGSGKTYLAKEIIRRNKAYTFVIIDILDIYGDLDGLNNVHRFVIDPLDEERLNKIIRAGLEVGAFFVIDEMHSLPYSRYKLLRYLILAGRNKGSGWVAISQFPSQISKTVIGNANLSFLFENFEKNAVKYLTETYEVTEEELRELKGHYFYLARYSEIVRDGYGRPIKFILK